MVKKVDKSEFGPKAGAAAWPNYRFCQAGIKEATGRNVAKGFQGTAL